MLISISGAASATFVYDGDGQRVKATMGGTTTAYLGLFNSYAKHILLDNYRS